MRFKVVPEPVDSLAAVAAVRDDVPLVPDEEESCCARLVRRGHVASQDAAREWLTFLRALGLVEEVDGQFRRLAGGGGRVGDSDGEGDDGADAGDDGAVDSIDMGDESAGEGHHDVDAALDPAALRRAFRERVYLAAEALAVLADADGPLEPAAVYAVVADRVPHWERRRRTDPDAVWEERVERILEWAVLLGLAARTDEGTYEPADVAD